MGKSIVTGLLQNTAILLALSLLYEFWWLNESYKKLFNRIITGILIGIAGIILMLTPWTLVPGIIFDTRSVLLSVSGLFFGFVPTAIAVLLTGIFRIIQGGGGMWMGIAVIITSGLSGVLWNKYRPGWKEKNYIIELLALGYIVHLIMMGCTVLLPEGMIATTLKAILIPLLTVYPAGTLLLGTLMVHQYNNWQNRLAARKLLEVERRFSDMLKNMTLYSTIVKPDGTIIFCNDAFLKETGYSIDEVTGKNAINIFVPEEHRKDIFGKIKNIYDNNPGRQFSYETEVQRKDGSKIIVSWNYTVLKDDKTGDITGIASIGENITERKRAEVEILKAKIKAEESDRLKSEFLANMSHEIRTPLNAITGFANLLIISDLTEEEKKQYHSIIRNSSDRLLHLINDIVDISKLEAGQMQLDISPCNLYELVKTCVETARISPEFIKKENLELRLAFPEEYRDLVILTDQKRVQQVLDNLISNAIKYTSQGFIETSVNVKGNSNDKFIEFCVKDTGAGIPADKKDLIFERFRKLDTDRFQEGAGLGLSISKGLVELLGGKIYVESEPGKGSSFCFTIPLKTGNLQIPASKEALNIKTDLKGKKILIAEDDIYSFLYIKQIISESGAVIFHAENGVDVLEITRKTTPDILLLDICMPVMDGFEVLKKLKTQNINTLVIAQTAYAMSGEKEKCLSLGCHGYIAKPFSKAELLSVIAEALKNAGRA